MHLLNLKWLFSLIILVHSTLYPQLNNFRFENYSINSGLSNTSINAILQTKNGFLWIATKDGLNRFDGQNFKIYKNNPSIKNTLSENYVMSLLEANDGTFWIGTWGGGLCRFDPFAEKFFRIDLDYADDDYIQFLFEDHQKNIWYGTTTGGLNKYIPSTKKIITYRKENRNEYFFPDNEITWITEDDKKNIWAATPHSGLVGLNPFSNKLTIIRSSTSKANSLSSDFVMNIFNHQNKYLLLGTAFGVDKINLTDKSILHNPSIPRILNNEFNVAIKHILQDYNGNLWIGTYDYLGLYFIENPFTPAQKITHITLDEKDSHSLISNRIRWLYEDKNFNLWVGTEEGISKLPVQKPFKKFMHDLNMKNTLGGKVVSSLVYGGNEILWVGYGGSGFDKINLKSNSIKHFGFNPNSKNTLSNADVVSMYLDKKGILWIGTMVGGLNSFDTLMGKFKSYRHLENQINSLKSDWVQQFLETKDGKLLIGTNEGLQIFDRKKEVFYDYNPSTTKGSAKIPKHVSVNSLFEDKVGNIYVGTWLDGLYVYYKEMKIIYHFIPDKNDPKSISSSKIIFIQQDSRGFIWLGTHSGGLNKFDPTLRKFTRYSTYNGLPNDVVFGIQEDKNGYLWISTLNGLAKFDPRKESFRIYDQADGLISNSFNWRASCKDQNGNLYFGGDYGFILFNPDDIKIDRSYSPIAFTSFKVFNKEAALPKSLPATKEITLSYEQNFFSIEFAALDLAPSYKHKYMYKLEGIDRDWIFANSRNTAYYTDIDPGEYRFLVKAGNADNVWNSSSSIIIKLTPAWWMTWWFKTGVAIAIIFLGFWIYRLRVNQLIKIERIRYDIASDLHDEIGSNLSSISVDGQLLLKSKSMLPNEKELITDISKTAAQTLDAMRDIVWFINPKNDENEDIIFKMKETAAKLLGGIEWSFKIDGSPKLDSFSLEQRRNLFLIYKEVLTNIARHSEAKKCAIHINGTSSQLRLIIEDDGMGFDEENVKVGTGLMSIRNRAKKANASIEIKSRPGSGTIINLFTSVGKI